MKTLGDPRLERVKDKILSAMVKRQTVILRRLGKNRAEEVSYGRFINNDSVTPEGLIDSQASFFNASCRDKHILLVEDTTAASFGLHQNRSSLGYVGKSTQVSGFHMHPAIGVDALTGGYLGILGLHVWKRPTPQEPIIDLTLDQETQKELKKAFKKKQRKDLWKQPFEQKEYYKWYSVIEKAVNNCPYAKQYTIVSDREGDVYEALCGYHQKGWDYVVRSSYDRKLSPLAHTEGNEPISSQEKTLHKALDSWEVQGCYSLKLPKTDKRSVHQAHLDIKFGQVVISWPNWSIKQQYEPTLPLYVVEVKEQSSTAVNGENPIHWILMTSHKVETVQDALIIIQWYKWRWLIEQTFRTIKSEGLAIESSEVESYEALINLATLTLLAAVLVMQLVQDREEQTQQNLEDVFTPIEIACLQQVSTQLEGSTQKQKNPHPKNTLAFASWVVARLGGWSGYINKRPPGPITMMNGLTRFYDIFQGFTLNLQNYQNVNELVCIP
jgi:hypothetical protein